VKITRQIKTDGNKDENTDKHTDMSKSNQLVILICTYIHTYMHSSHPTRYTPFSRPVRGIKRIKIKRCSHHELHTITIKDKG